MNKVRKKRGRKKEGTNKKWKKKQSKKKSERKKEGRQERKQKSKKNKQLNKDKWEKGERKEEGGHKEKGRNQKELESEPGRMNKKMHKKENMGGGGVSLFGGVRQLVLSASLVALLYSSITPQTLHSCCQALIHLLHLVHLHLQNGARFFLWTHKHMDCFTYAHKLLLRSVFDHFSLSLFRNRVFSPYQTYRSNLQLSFSRK